MVGLTEHLARFRKQNEINPPSVDADRNNPLSEPCGCLLQADLDL